MPTDAITTPNLYCFLLDSHYGLEPMMILLTCMFFLLLVSCSDDSSQTPTNSQFKSLTISTKLNATKDSILLSFSHDQYQDKSTICKIDIEGDGIIDQEIEACNSQQTLSFIDKDYLAIQSHVYFYQSEKLISSIHDTLTVDPSIIFTPRSFGEIKFDSMYHSFSFKSNHNFQEIKFYDGNGHEQEIQIDPLFNGAFNTKLEVSKQENTYFNIKSKLSDGTIKTAYFHIRHDFLTSLDLELPEPYAMYDSSTTVNIGCYFCMINDETIRFKDSTSYNQGYLNYAPILMDFISDYSLNQKLDRQLNISIKDYTQQLYRIEIPLKINRIKNSYVVYEVPGNILSSNKENTIYARYENYKYQGIFVYNLESNKHTMLDSISPYKSYAKDNFLFLHYIENVWDDGHLMDQLHQYKIYDLDGNLIRSFTPSSSSSPIITNQGIFTSLNKYLSPDFNPTPFSVPSLSKTTFSEDSLFYFKGNSLISQNIVSGESYSQKLFESSDTLSINSRPFIVDQNIYFIGNNGSSIFTEFKDGRINYLGQVPFSNSITSTDNYLVYFTDTPFNTIGINTISLDSNKDISFTSIPKNIRAIDQDLLLISSNEQTTLYDLKNDKQLTWETDKQNNNFFIGEGGDIYFFWGNTLFQLNL